MNSHDFAKALNDFFVPERLDSMETLLESPPRSATTVQLELSQWFRSLAPEDRQRVLVLLREAVTNCVFSFLVLLDNCDSVSSEEETGYFELFYATASSRVRLNVISEGPSDPQTYREANEALASSGQTELLHDLFLDSKRQHGPS